MERDRWFDVDVYDGRITDGRTVVICHAVGHSAPWWVARFHNWLHYARDYRHHRDSRPIPLVICRVLDWCAGSGCLVCARLAAGLEWYS